MERNGTERTKMEKKGIERKERQICSEMTPMCVVSIGLPWIALRWHVSTCRLCMLVCQNREIFCWAKRPYLILKKKNPQIYPVRFGRFTKLKEFCVYMRKHTSRCVFLSLQGIRMFWIFADAFILTRKS